MILIKKQVKPKNFTSTLAVLAMIFTLSACSISSTAVTSFRSSFDFSSVKTYSIYDRNSVFGESQNLSDITRNTIELAIEQSLDNNGFHYVTVKKADIVIAYHLISSDLSELKHYNQQIKYCVYCLKAGKFTGKELQKKLRVGSLVLDIIDSNNQRSVWRSVYPLGIKVKDNSQEIQQKISKAVHTMLQTYPKK